jgi:hypothetical protein
MREDRLRLSFISAVATRPDRKPCGFNRFGAIVDVDHYARDKLCVCKDRYQYGR